MRCAGCGLEVEWYPPKNRWAAKIADTGTAEVWSFLCLPGVGYHHIQPDTMKPGYTKPVARRHLQLTVDITLDEDLCRTDDTPQPPDGGSLLTDSLNILRTALHHHTAIILAPYDPHATIALTDEGVVYGPDDTDTTF